MKDDKKKTIVLAALVLVIVAVGAFQFTAGSSSAAAPAPVAEKKQEEKKPQQAEQEETDPPKNPLLVANLPARDPFQATALAADPKVTPQPAPTPQPQPQPEPRATPLPDMQINKTGDFGPGGNVPVKVEAPPEAKFSFTLSGVMLGAKPIAVFTDAQGGQRLILLGASLDPDTKVISIDKDAVTVRFHGKTLRLTVEGNPNAKK